MSWWQIPGMIHVTYIVCHGIKLCLVNVLEAACQLFNIFYMTLCLWQNVSCQCDLLIYYCHSNVKIRATVEISEKWMTICLTRRREKSVNSWQRRTLWWINKILRTSFAHLQSPNIIHLPKQVRRHTAFFHWIAQLKGWQVSVRIYLYAVCMPKLCYPLHSIPTLYFAITKLNCISAIRDFSV